MSFSWHQFENRHVSLPDITWLKDVHCSIDAQCYRNVNSCDSYELHIFWNSHDIAKEGISFYDIHELILRWSGPGINLAELEQADGIISETKLNDTSNNSVNVLQKFRNYIMFM
jgi:hypothetical protein